MSEKVLCIRRWLFERLTGCYFKGGGFGEYNLELTERWAIDREHISFVSRDICETDPSWLQIIPYILVTNRNRLREDAGIAVYERGVSGGEARLHGNMSIGFGGHINEEDTLGSEVPESPYGDVYSAILAATSRELSEELVMPEIFPDWKNLGWVFDGSNDVGRVHVGAVMVVDLGYGQVEGKESCIRALRTVPANSIFKPVSSTHAKFETWSRILLTSGIYHDGEFSGANGKCSVIEER